MWKTLKEMGGVQVCDLEEFTDPRGSLSEFWRNDEMRHNRAAYDRPAMGYMSWTLPNQVRGPHEHRDQADLFVFAGPGAFALYLWTYKQSRGTGDLSIDHFNLMAVGDPAVSIPGCKRRAVLVPPGVVHGYKCVSKMPGLVINLPDKLYRGPQKKYEVDEIRHEDDPNSPFKIPEG